MSDSESESSDSPREDVASRWAAAPASTALPTSASLLKPQAMHDASESGSESSDSEPEDSGRHWKAAPKALPTLAGVLQPSSWKGAPSTGGYNTALPKARPVGSLQLPPQEAAPRSAQCLIPYLKRENARLREALREAALQAQLATDCKVAEEGEKEVAKPVDFAHLLELVKELGDGGSFDELDETSTTADAQDGAYSCNFSISTPRDSEACALELEVARLQQELLESRHALSESRQEVAALRGQLAERDD